jgi:hypothetical protein
MSHGASTMPPLLIKWSPGRVDVFDPTTRSVSSGTALGDCLNGHTAGREAVVAISQRSTFLRTLQVPSLSKEETAQILATELGPTMPLESGAYVFGFRLGGERSGAGRLAVVGAVKTATLRSIDRDCNEHGLKLRAVVPLAFGAWLAARERLLVQGAVVEADGASLTVDIVSEGELRYSRSVPLPHDRTEIDEEIARSFEIAEVETGPTLSPGNTIQADFADPKSSLEHLADPHVIDRLLFTLELPERVEARRTKALGRVAQRAILTAVLAVVLVALGAVKFQRVSTKAAADQVALRSELVHSQNDQTRAVTDNLGAQDQRLLIDAAFKPAQSFSDVLRIVSDLAPSGIALTGVTLDRGKPIIIRGTATTSRAAAKYAARLNKEHRFRHMTLLSVNRTNSAHSQVVEFAISGHMVGNLPIDRVPTEAKP